MTDTSKPLTAELQERIHDHIYAKDRETEPHFAGRQALQSFVKHELISASKGYTAGSTICLSGPPGIGKTAFMKKFEETHTQQGTAQEILPVFVKIGPDTLHDPNRVMSEIITTLMPHISLTKISLELIGQAAREYNLDLSRFHESFDNHISSKNKQAAESSGRRFHWKRLESIVQWIKGEKPVVIALMIDEAHALRGDDGKTGGRNALLADLHAGGIVPIVPILAGHCHTLEVLEASISGRFSDGHLVPMQTLSSIDAYQYASKMLAYYQGLDNMTDRDKTSPEGRHRDIVARWIADECGGFPHHLRNNIVAIGREMIIKNTSDLSKLDPDEINKNNSMQRKRYYDSRISGPIGYCEETTIAVIQKIETRKKWGPFWKKDLRDVIAMSLKDADEDIGMRPDEVLSLMRRKGIVAEDESGRPTCLIPSLKRYILEGEHRPQNEYPVKAIQSLKPDKPSRPSSP